MSEKWAFNPDSDNLSANFFAAASFPSPKFCNSTEPIIEKFVPMENIYIGNTMWTAGLEGPGQVKLFGSGSVELQNLGDGKEAAAKKLADKLSESGLNI